MLAFGQTLEFQISNYTSRHLMDLYLLIEFHSHYIQGLSNECVMIYITYRFKELLIIIQVILYGEAAIKPGLVQRELNISLLLSFAPLFTLFYAHVYFIQIFDSVDVNYKVPGPRVPTEVYPLRTYLIVFVLLYFFQKRIHSWYKQHYNPINGLYDISDNNDIPCSKIKANWFLIKFLFYFNYIPRVLDFFILEDGNGITEFYILFHGFVNNYRFN